MKTLEKLLNIGASCLIGLGLFEKLNDARAEILDYANPDSINIIATADSNAIGKSSICENYISWEQAGSIYVKNRTTNLQTLVASTNAKNPNLDSVNGNKLVYDKDGSIYMYDLVTKRNILIYQKQGSEICSNPKINGDNLVFRMYANFEEFGLEVGSIVGYSIPEESFYPVSNSLDKKSEPDIFGRYVVWTQEGDNIAYANDRKFSNKIYDLENAVEMTLADNFVTNDVASNAVYGDKVVGVANSMSWDGGPASLVIHDLSYYEADSNPREDCIGMGLVHSDWGKKGQVSIYGNLMVWTEIYKGGYIKGVDLTSRMSIEQFVIAGPGCYNPDVYVDPNGSYNVIYMTNSGPITQGGFSTLGQEDSNSYLVSTKIKPYGREDMKKCGDRGTVYLTGDLNKDCYVDMGDLEIIASSWLREGLGMDRPRDGNDLNTDPNNWQYICDVGPEVMIEDRRVYLDFNWDCKLGLEDYSKFAQDWMKCTDPANSNCDKYWTYRKEY